MRRLLPYALIGLLVAGSFVLTSNQGSGPNAATRLITRVTDGGEAVVESNGSNLRINGVNLVATANGDAVLIGQIVNRTTSDDKLLSISVGTDKATISGLADLAPNAPIYFEGDHANAQAVFLGVPAVAGTFVDVNFGFAKAGLVTVRTKIQEQTGIYANIGTGAKLAETSK